MVKLLRMWVQFHCSRNPTYIASLVSTVPFPIRWCLKLDRKVVACFFLWPFRWPLCRQSHAFRMLSFILETALPSVLFLWGSFKFHKFRQESKSVAGSRPSCALVRSRTAHCIGQDRVRSLVYIQQHCTTFPFLPSHSWQHTFPSLPEASTPAVLHLSSLFLFKFWSGSFFFWVLQLPLASGVITLVQPLLHSLALV